MAQSHRGIRFWYRLGLAAHARPPRRFACAFNRGRGTSALKSAPVRNNPSEGEKPPPVIQFDRGAGNDATSGAPGCPWCRGTGVVTGVVDDIDFSFTCVCRGGDEGAVRWLIGDDRR